MKRPDLYSSKRKVDGYSFVAGYMKNLINQMVLFPYRLLEPFISPVLVSTASNVQEVKIHAHVVSFLFSPAVLTKIYIWIPTFPCMGQMDDLPALLLESAVPNNRSSSQSVVDSYDLAIAGYDYCFPRRSLEDLDLPFKGCDYPESFPLVQSEFDRTSRSWFFRSMLENKIDNIPINSSLLASHHRMLREAERTIFGSDPLKIIDGFPRRLHFILPVNPEFACLSDVVSRILSRTDFCKKTGHD